jgi:hypothetical protein
VCLVLICDPPSLCGYSDEMRTLQPILNAFTVYFVVRDGFCGVLLYYAGRDVTGYVYASACHCAAAVFSGVSRWLSTLSGTLPT